MPTYRCRPRIVEAEQFWPHVEPWPVGVRVAVQGGHIFPGEVTTSTPPTVSLMSWSFIYAGDWVVTNEEGKRRVVTDRVFQTLYEPVPVAPDDDIDQTRDETPTSRRLRAKPNAIRKDTP